MTCLGWSHSLDIIMIPLSPYVPSPHPSTETSFKDLRLWPRLLFSLISQCVPMTLRLF